MADLRAILVPDIGDFENIPVIEVLVKPGDTVKAKDSLITLECDKATMEIPVPFAGVVKELKINLGDKVSEGSAILTLDVAEITPFAISFGATLAKAARLVSTFVARPSFAKGLEACEQQDYVTALRILRRLAKKGDACSQLKIGEIYGSGLGAILVT